VLANPDLTSLTAVTVYAVVWGFLFAECGLLVGFLLPGDTILFGAGLLAGAPSGQVNLGVLVAGSFVAAVAGNEVGYLTGRRYSRSWLERRETGRARDHLLRAEGFYDRFGWVSVVAARWIPWVRTFTPVIAGTAAMRRASFTSANVVGALGWAVALPVLGYFAYQLPALRTIAIVIPGVAVVASFLGVAVVLVREVVRRRRRRVDGPGNGPPEGPTLSGPTSG
jgi:membrane-associated protein